MELFLDALSIGLAVVCVLLLYRLAVKAFGLELDERKDITVIYANECSIPLDLDEIKPVGKDKDDPGRNKQEMP